MAMELQNLCNQIKAVFPDHEVWIGDGEAGQRCIAVMGNPPISIALLHEEMTMYFAQHGFHTVPRSPYDGDDRQYTDEEGRQISVVTSFFAPNQFFPPRCVNNIIDCNVPKVFTTDQEL